MKARLFSFLLAAALLPPVAAAQMTAQEVFQNVAEQHEARMQDVETLIVTSKLEGDMALVDKMTTYYRKTDQGDQPVFETRVKAEGGMADAVNQGAASRMGQTDAFAMMRKMNDTLADEAEYRGTETLDGRTVHVLYVEDMTPLYRALAEEGGQAEVDMAGNATLYIDPDGWLLRKMSMEMQTDQGGEAHTMQMTTELQDYREAGGLLYPYRTVMTMENMLPPEQRKEMEEQMAKMRQRLEGLPPAQRAQVEKMMNASQGALGKEMQMIMAVEDVQVNANLPEGIFSE